MLDFRGGLNKEEIWQENLTGQITLLISVSGKSTECTRNEGMSLRTLSKNKKPFLAEILNPTKTHSDLSDLTDQICQAASADEYVDFKRMRGIHFPAAQRHQRLGQNAEKHQELTLLFQWQTSTENSSVFMRADDGPS
ncbi:hypothetical protein AV530_017085 [Patagioenas fasciata monilis]|uniref:Uncharacterized protein n=1 Tax=Patagioenas fasciata monilis TaxID=372326 RepID=A0A1V4J4Y4_PATFA|nr:hypothetical protein AV530_017085 [Patagioenas fasciata monilis]